MNHYQPDLYKEILDCYEYETRNPSIYGNVVRIEVEFTSGRKKLRIDKQRDENNI